MREFGARTNGRSNRFGCENTGILAGDSDLLLAYIAWEHDSKNPEGFDSRDVEKTRMETPIYGRCTEALAKERFA